MSGYYVSGGKLERTTYRVRAGGELDMATRADLSRSLEGASTAGATTLRLDFTEVTFIDSTAIKVIARAGEEVRSRGGQVEIAFGNPNVLKIFVIAGLERLFELSLVADRIGAEEPL
jgi:anti-sigma B factor antagonist